MTDQPTDPTAAQHADAPPAGYYPDPEQPGMMRWWDGTAWTQQRVPAGPSTPTPAPVSAPRRRLGTGAIVGIVLGSLALVALLSVGASVLLTRIVDTTQDAINGGEGRVLEASVPDDWAEFSVMDERGTIAIDPAWEDISEYFGLEAALSQASVPAGVTFNESGAWLLAGDLTNGGVSLTVTSVADVGGTSTARIEAQAYIRGNTEGLDGVEITSEGPITTSAGASGYMMTYEAPYLGEQLTGAVGVIVDGSSQLLVGAFGSEALGSGLTELETVLNSLTLD